MRVLILGGTKFLGRHLVAAALARGHTVTLFNRGRTNPHLFPEVEKLAGDRDGGLDLLKGRSWDAVVDTSGYVPAQVEATAGLLAGAAGHYTFISSISVYGNFSKPGLDENSPVATLPPGVDPNENNGAHYGAKKALCEQAIEKLMPGRTLNVRAGILVGPYDFMNRLAYWVARMARGGEVLCPASTSARVQLIDARDLADWIIHMAQAGKAGCFNATGPADLLTFPQMLETCQAVASRGDVRPVWVDEKFLVEQGVQPFTDLPLWIPETRTDFSRFFALDCSRAIHNGLRFRPLTDTVRDVLAEIQGPTGGTGEPNVARLSAEREAKLLRAWRNLAHAP